MEAANKTGHVLCASLTNALCTADVLSLLYINGRIKKCGTYGGEAPEESRVSFLPYYGHCAPDYSRVSLMPAQVVARCCQALRRLQRLHRLGFDHRRSHTLQRCAYFGRWNHPSKCNSRVLYWPTK
jgi:hypothetical protein